MTVAEPRTPPNLPPTLEEAECHWIDLSVENERLKAHIKRLERRIHNQRVANRTTWEIVERRANYMGSTASRQTLIRHIQWLREARAEIAALRSDR